MHYVMKWRGHFALLVTMVVLAAGCAVAVQYAMKLLVDGMAGPRNGGAVWTALAIFIALIAAESVLWRLSGWLGCRTTIGVGVEMRLDLFDFLSGQPMRYFAENMAGSLGHRITGSAGNFGALSNTVVWRVLPPCVDFLGALVIFATVDWRMTVVLGIFVVLVTSGLIQFGERGRPLHRAYGAKAGQVGGELIDVISNMWAVKAYSAKFRERGRLAGLFSREAEAQRKSWLYVEWTRVIYDVVLLFLAGGMLAWAVRLWATGSITPGDVVMVSALTFRILHGSRDLAMALVEMVQQFGYIDETLQVIGQPQTVVDAPNAVPFQPRGGSVELRDVTFAYGSGHDALRNVNLHVPAGQKLGVVGPSGAGKSTIVHLIQRLYDVQSGQILIDDQPVGQMTQDSLRAGLAVVPQEIILFHRSVMDNIRFGRPEATDKEVLEAASAAHCEAFINRLPKGWDTIVGERGTKLSGGQRQRIGIARAFLKDAPVIIFDEATSALDSESELEIQRALIERMRHRTAIAVAHRLSTLAAFDRIIVVNDGRIVEEGTPSELRGSNSLFDKMWRLQAEGFALTPS